MGENASSHRIVAGCTRCLRTALNNLRSRDDARQGPSVTLAGTLLAGSMAVASGSRRLRDALASIPIHDEGGALEGDRASQAGVRRRMAMATPAVAAGLFAGIVAATPAQAEPGDLVRQAQTSQSVEPGAAPGGKVRRARDVPSLAASSFSVANSEDGRVVPVAARHAEDGAAPAVGSGRKVRPSEGAVETLLDAIAPSRLPDPGGEARDRGQQGDRGGEAPDPVGELVGRGGSAADPGDAQDGGHDGDRGREPQDPVGELMGWGGPVANLGRLAPEPRRPDPTPAPADVTDSTVVPSVVLSGDPASLDLAVRAVAAGWDDVAEAEGDQDDAGDDESPPVENDASVDAAAAPPRTEPCDPDEGDDGESDDDGSAQSDEADEPSDSEGDDESSAPREPGEASDSGEGDDESAEWDAGDEAESSESDQSDEVGEASDGDDSDDESSASDESGEAWDSGEGDDESSDWDEGDDGESSESEEADDGDDDESSESEESEESEEADEPSDSDDGDDGDESEGGAGAGGEPVPAPPEEDPEADDSQWVPQAATGDLGAQTPAGSA